MKDKLIQKDNIKIKLEHEHTFVNTEKGKFNCKHCGLKFDEYMKEEKEKNAHTED